MRERVYLDWNATTPLRPEARAAMAHALDVVGNPSSVHAEGRLARGLIEDAREVVAAGLGTERRSVIFTSGGTEANILALVPGLRRGADPAGRLLVSAIEHASVLAGGRFAPESVDRIAVLPDGTLDLDALQAKLSGPVPALVSVMLANNETGALQPIPEIARLVHDSGGLLHVDAVQAFGKMPISINALGADLVSISAHKIGGPKGIGALVVAGDLRGLDAALRGGGQEQGRRAGTENVPGIAGFGAAAGAAAAGMERDRDRMQSLRDRLEAGLKTTPGVTVFADRVPRLPNTTLFSMPGLNAETAVIGFDLEGIAVSSGSACSSGKVQPSHVLQAMGVAPNLVRGAIRLSLGWTTAISEIDRALEGWRKVAKPLLKSSDETVLERF